MKAIFRPLAALAAFTALACTSDIAEPICPDINSLGTEDPYIIKGEMIIELSDDLVTKVEADLTKGNFLATKADGMNSAFTKVGAMKVERLYDDGGEWEARHREAGLHRFYKVIYNPSVPSSKASAELQSVEGIISAEPERQIQTDAVSPFNDPDFSRQWHLYNASYAGKDMNVVKVWQQFTAGSSNVIVAVVDHGVDPTHQDLAPVVIPGGPNGSKNFINNNYTITGGRHGTHVGGLIGAVNNNGKNGCGVAGGSDGTGGVRILSCQVFQDSGPQGSTYNAIVWAADHGAVIVNNSWSTKYNSAAEAARGSVGSYKSAIDYFIRYAGCDGSGNQRPDSPMKGGLVFFSAGNNNWPDNWPAEYSAAEPCCISVGALDRNLNKMGYSSYGDWVTLSAPGGENVTGSAYMIFSTVPTNGIAGMAGTSQACPNAAGVAALLLSYYGGPGYTNTQLRERLVKGARDLPNLKSSKLGPAVDAYESMCLGLPKPPEAVTDLKTGVTYNSITAQWTVTKDPDHGKAYGYVAYITEDKDNFENFDVNNLPEGVIASEEVLVGTTAVGKRVKTVFSGLKESTVYYVAVIGYDVDHNYSPLSSIVRTKTSASKPPVIKTDYADSSIVKVGSIMNIDFTVEDAEGDVVTIGFSGDLAAAEKIDLPGGGLRFSIFGDKNAIGTHTAYISAADAAGHSTGIEFTYIIEGNRPPVITTAKEEDGSLTVAVSDPDNDMYRVSFTPGSAAAKSELVSSEEEVSVYKLTITPGAAPAGRYTARYVVTDSNGATASYNYLYKVD